MGAEGNGAVAVGNSRRALKSKEGLECHSGVYMKEKEL